MKKIIKAISTLAMASWTIYFAPLTLECKICLPFSLPFLLLLCLYKYKLPGVIYSLLFTHPKTHKLQAFSIFLESSIPF